MFIMLVGTDTDEVKSLQGYVAGCYPDSVICSFADSRKALDFIKSESMFIDLCFTEIVMPGVSGFGIVTELRRYSKKTKIVFIADTPEYASSAWDYCVNDYFLKPITAKSIQHTMTSCASGAERCTLSG